MRNNDSKQPACGFDCFKFQFHRGRAATFATKSARSCRDLSAGQCTNPRSNVPIEGSSETRLTGFATDSILTGERNAPLFEPAKDEEVLTALVAALTRAFDDGSPVSGQSLERRRDIAVAALRRIRSFRRRRVPNDDRSSCIRDLAKGLINYLEAKPDLVGPLMKDYQFVASQLLDAYQTVVTLDVSSRGESG